MLVASNSRMIWQMIKNSSDYKSLSYLDRFKSILYHVGEETGLGLHKKRREGHQVAKQTCLTEVRFGKDGFGLNARNTLAAGKQSGSLGYKACEVLLTTFLQENRKSGI